MLPDLRHFLRTMMQDDEVHDAFAGVERRRERRASFGLARRGACASRLDWLLEV